MPLLPHYTWEESSAAIKLVVQAPGLTKAKTDLLICDIYLRVNFPPYLLQLDLLHPIDDANSTAVFGLGTLTCHLNKVQPVTWGQLTAQGSKRELQDRRGLSQHRLELRLQQDKQARLEKAKVLNKAASDKRIELDRQKRETIEQHKQRELQAQKADVASWQESVAPQDAESDYEDDDMDEAQTKHSQDHDQYHGKGWQAKKAKGPSQSDTRLSADAAMDHNLSTENAGASIERQAIWNESVEADSVEQPTDSEQSSFTTYDQEAAVTSRVDLDSQASDVDLPPVRSGCTPVTVNFTKLETEHLPARETREQEISSHKRKAQETKASMDSVHMSERQPMFLKDKGDTMHRSGNYRAAINAYTKALEIDASLSVCYANRAASYLKSQEFRLCIDDCTTALAQMEEAMGASTAGSSTSAIANHSSMLKLLTRRAAAYIEIQELHHAQADLQEAVKRSPRDETLKADLREVQACLQPADSKLLRALADERFKAQDFQGAADAYSAVLAVANAPSADKLAAASNRAACSLAQGNYSSAVDDCTVAFELLTGQDILAIPDMHAWLAHAQGPSAEPQKQSLARLLARRGMALGHLGRGDEAVADLEAAQQIYTALGQQAKGNALKADITKIKQLCFSRDSKHATG